MGTTLLKEYSFDRFSRIDFDFLSSSRRQGHDSLKGHDGPREMGLLGTISNYVWIPYLILCTGLLCIFATQEFLLLQKYNKAVEAEDQYLTRSLFRRDVGVSQEDTLAEWLSNIPTSDVSVLRELLDDEPINQTSVEADIETSDTTDSGLELAKIESTQVKEEPAMAPTKLLLNS